jgi:hypothetical protein
MTKSVDPFRRAEWTLEAVYNAVDNHLFNVYNNRTHPALGLSPNEFERQRDAEMGARAHRFIKFDEDIMLLTSPRTKKVRHRLDPVRGIYANRLHYRHPAMNDVAAGTELEVRIEPWAHNVIYVLIGGRWVAAVATDSRATAGRTTKEVDIALRHQRNVALALSLRDRFSPSGLRERARYLSPMQFDTRLGEQVKEMRYVFERRDMTIATEEARSVVAKTSGNIVVVTDAKVIDISAKHIKAVIPDERADEDSQTADRLFKDVEGLE